MSSLLIAILIVLLLPLFLGSWRSSLAGLSLQGLLMGSIALRASPDPDTMGEWLTLVDLYAVRGVVAPLLLYQVLRAKNAPSRHDIIPPNLLSWTLALVVVLVAFNAAELLCDEAGREQTRVAVSFAGVMLGFLILATQSSAFSQMVGLLRIENAIALLELGAAPHDIPIALQIGQIVAVLVSVFLLRWYLGLLGPNAGSLPPAAEEMQTL